MAAAEGSWLERTLDTVVAAWSPGRARKRRHFRRMDRDEDYRESYELYMRLRGYKAAKTGTNDTPWESATTRNADGEILFDLPKLRSRSRAACRDDAIASGILKTRRRQVVGKGMRPQVRTGTLGGSRELDSSLESVWRERKDTLAPSDGDMTHCALQRMLYTRKETDGEILRVPTKTDADEPVWFETVEADRLATPLDARPVDPEGRIVNGVEKDRWGRPVAYWIAKRHPGDMIQHNTTGKPAQPLALNTAQFSRVPKDRVKHLRSNVTRPGQTRGVPLFHACLQDLHDLDLLIVATLKRSQIAACLALFIQSDAEGMDDLVEATAEDYGFQLDHSITPGMIFKLYPGETVSSVIPSFSIPDLEPFVWLLARRIGSSVEMSPQAVLHEWGSISYSAARTIQLEDRLSYDAERSDFAQDNLTWEWVHVMEDAQLRGDPRLAGVTPEQIRAVTWIGDARQWVDPTKEAQAIEIKLRLGLTTKADECAALGKDWEELLRQRLIEESTEQEMRAELGLAPAGAPEALTMLDGGKEAEAA